MAFFYSFTDSLKNKWLQFFQANREWIKLHMDVESVYTPDGGKRPSSYLILGVVNALEPKLSQLMLPFSRLNTDADTLLDVLGLNFDPDMVLGNKLMPPAAEETEDNGEFTTEVVTQSSDEQLVVGDTQTDDFGEADHGETLMVSQEVIQNELSQMSGDDTTITNDFQANSGVETDDAFENISFDEQSNDLEHTAPEAQMDESMVQEFQASENGGFDEVLKDVWSEETASHQSGEGDNQFFSGEGESRDPFDDTEMAELFPNN